VCPKASFRDVPGPMVRILILDSVVSSSCAFTEKLVMMSKNVINFLKFII
jgi:hypothetical protein